jgi:cytoskeletal protein CcmA (bactofilin family)
VSLFRKERLPSVSGKIENVLGANTSFSGTIQSDENIRIDGVYQGHIETAGNVIVGPSAKVLADIVANAVQVWGAVKGNITAQGRLEILPAGRIWGDIRVGSLLIDEGGVFRGQCVMGGEQVEPLLLPDMALKPEASPDAVGSGSPTRLSEDPDTETTQEWDEEEEATADS